MANQQRGKSFRKPIRNPPGNPAIMYPSLHQDVLNVLYGKINPEPVFNEFGNDDDVEQNYSTNIMGKFKCPNRNCTTHGWSSKRVAILIRWYANHGYNAVVFNQRCKSCDHLGSLTIDENAYIERVRYRLLKFAGVQVTPPPYRGEQKGTLPHKTELCEGCKRGYCEGSVEFDDIY
ncbi:zinc-binding domain-containing protein [Podospora australis]|uniref:Zinc-binding domain-containing protein n=1 Tax=Podospora australis TaxID=1536484 RepID=A0AAN6WS72_9PEZI|nr:zinc-binding domain-containing protein [Podospora australis]